MASSHFLWPKPARFQPLAAVLGGVSCDGLEGKLATLYPGGTPVLTTSGRNAIVLSLRALGLGRPDPVSIFPYASHCVIDAVGFVATPIEQEGHGKAVLLHHPWALEAFIPKDDATEPPVRIEDAVDTLVRPGNALFVNGGQFEIWSLPKIIGSSAGAVLWCRDSAMAATVRRLRNAGRGSWLPLLLRSASQRWPALHSYWRGVELEVGTPARQLVKEIWGPLDRLEERFALRRRKAELLEPWRLTDAAMRQDRLGPVVPVEPTDKTQDAAQRLGLHPGLRHLQMSSGDLKKVLPVPIHEDVDMETLDAFASALRS